MLRVSLGETGLQVSLLAIGTGTHGWNFESAQTRRGIQWLIEHLKKGYEMGVTFWDLADQYGTHRCAKEAKKGIERDKLVLTTKTTASDYESCSKALERFQQELDTDYLDIVLLHAKDSSDWNVTHRGAMDALNDAKAKGIVKAVGISSHKLKGIETAATEPWVDVILAPINYAGARMDASKESFVQVLSQAHESGKGIYAMKTLGCGELASDPEKGIKYILGLDCIDAMTMGHTEDDQLEQNVEVIERIAG